MANGFRAYYKRVMYQVLSDCKSHLVRTATAVVIALGAAFLQAQYFAFPGTQAWQRAATTVVVTVLVFVVYVLYYAVRAPWKLDTVRHEEMKAARLEVENLEKEHAVISGTPPALDVTIQEIYIQPRLSRDYSHIAKWIEDNSIGDEEFTLIKQYIDNYQTLQLSNYERVLADLVVHCDVFLHVRVTSRHPEPIVVNDYRLDSSFHGSPNHTVWHTGSFLKRWGLVTQITPLGNGQSKHSGRRVSELPLEFKTRGVTVDGWLNFMVLHVQYTELPNTNFRVTFLGNNWATSADITGDKNAFCGSSKFDEIPEETTGARS
jgi:hypothetical protein